MAIWGKLIANGGNMKRLPCSSFHNIDAVFWQLFYIAGYSQLIQINMSNLAVNFRTMNIEKAKQGNEIYYAGGFYRIAEIKDFPHGKMIGIFDEPPSKHIGYLNPESVSEVYPCYACQGGGCPVCSGYGKIVGS